MRVVIEGRPVFHLTVSKAMVRDLMNYSRNHYDGVCRSAGEVGGFVYGWSNMVDGQETAEVKATWRQLDTTLKLCESPLAMIDPETGARVSNYIWDVSYAMSLARDQKWEIVAREK